MFEKVFFNNKLYAIIIYSTFKKDGIEFFTPNELSQQLAYMKHPAGKKITPHLHKEVERIVMNTLETLFIKSGKLRVDFYDENKKFLGNKILGAGDTILLIQGGHGFEVLEDLEMIEVKQGPYVGEEDKIRFEGEE